MTRNPPIRPPLDAGPLIGSCQRSRNCVSGDSHVSPGMRATLKAALQARWESSLRERAQLSPHSIVPALDALLAPFRGASVMIRSHPAPEIGQ
jgi:hypothetical protein